MSPRALVGSTRASWLPLLFLPLCLAACGGDDDALRPAPTATLTVAPTPTPTMAPPATPTSTPTETATPSPTAAKFEAHGSVRQVYVVDSEPGADLRLLGPDGGELRRAAADTQGSLLFRDVEPGDGYTVELASAAPRTRSAPVRVTSAEEVPAPSFYADQQLVSGYQYLRTRDGTLLAVNVILPGSVDGGPYPTVIEYSGYDPANPSNPQPSTRIAAALGYAAVGINMRGSGCSGGAFDYFETLQVTDGYDAVEVVAAQPWVKGHKVGMVGISYPGISQLFVASLQPPHLAAIAPLSVLADIGQGILYPGGILNNGFATQFAADRQHDAMPGGQRWSQDRIDAGDQTCIANQKLRFQSADLMEKIDANPYYVPAVADPLSPQTFVDKIDVPVFLAGAWQDEQTGSYFATMLDRFTGSDKAHFTLTNGNHIEPLSPEVFSRWMEFLDLYVAERKPLRPIATPLILQVLDDAIFQAPALALPPLRFTDAASYEEALAAFEADRRVRVLFENGAGATPGAPVPTFEQSFDAWPIPSLEATPWYFAEGGRLDPAAPAADGSDGFAYDPSSSQRTNYPGPFEDVWHASVNWDWRPLESGKSLAYATDPLAATLVMAGSGSVDLWLQASAPDVDLQVTLSEIRPDAQEVYVQSGWLRTSHRKLNESRSTALRPVPTHLEADAADLPPGEFVEARVEIYPFAHVFRAGSRIRVSVEAPGGDRAAWKFAALAPGGDVQVTVSRSPATPSRVVLPVVPNVEAPAALPACPSLRGQPCRAYQG